MCQCVAGFRDSVHGQLAYVGGSHNDADTPAAIIGRSQRIAGYGAVTDGVVGCGICTGMSNETANRTVAGDRTVFHRAVVDGDLRVNGAIVLVVVSRCPADETADTGTASTGDGAVGQVAVRQGNHIHGIHRADEGTDTGRRGGVIDRDTVQRQLINDQPGAAGKSAGEQRRIQAGNGMTVSVDGNGVSAVVAVNIDGGPVFTLSQRDII